MGSTAVGALDTRIGLVAGALVEYVGAGNDEVATRESLRDTGQ
jgi:hypothetical protein